MNSRAEKIVMLSLFHVSIPGGKLEAFVDNSDSLWKAFDRYAASNGLQAIQMFTVGEGLKHRRMEVIQKDSTTFYFLPKNPLKVFWWLWRMLHNVVILHLNNESWSDAVAALLGKLRGARIVVFLHNNPDPSAGKIPRTLRRLFRSHVVDAYMTNSPLTKQRFNRKLAVPMYVFSFGFDPSLFFPARRRAHKILRLLYVGRISSDKKIDDIVEGIARSPARETLLLNIVGDDPTPGQPYLERLLSLMKDRGVRFRYWGFLPHSRLATAYHDSDLFVNLRPDEPFGKVFIEAMATGLPIFGRTGAAGTELLIREKINGRKVDSVDHLAQLLDYYARHPVELRRMGRRAFAFVTEHYSESESFKSLQRAYDDLRAGYVAEKLFYEARPWILLRRIKRMLLNQRVDRSDHVLVNGTVMHKEQAALYEYCKGRGIDVGCGNNKTHPGAIGVDITPKGNIGVFGNQKGQISVADIQASGDNLYMFRDGELDYVVARHNLEHYQDPIKTLCEWRRVVRKGGFIGIVLPDDTFRDTIHLDPTHYHVFTPESFRTIVDLLGGLKIEKLEPCVQDWSFVCVMRKL